MAANNAKLSLDELAQQYGYAASFFGSDPELWSLVNQATREQWSVSKFQAKFMASNWYRGHAASQRTWLEQESRDPQTTNRQIQIQEAKIQQMATADGIYLDYNRLHQMARDTLMWGTSEQELKNTLAAEYKYSPGGHVGNASAYEDQVRKAAGDYGVTVSNESLSSMVGGLLSGQMNMNSINGFMQNMAKSKYPGLSSYLDQGMTVRDVADPYIQSYSTILEKAPTTVDLSDPLIQKALQGVNQKPATGTTSMTGAQPVQPQSLYEFETSLRQDPRWLQTKGARDQMVTAGQSILQDWGLVK